MFKKRFSLFGVILICIVVIGGLIGAGVYWLQGNIGSASDLFRLAHTVRLIQKNYVGDVDADTLYKGALRGMVKALDDPYSAYLDEKSFTNLESSTEGHFGGVGIVLGRQGENFVVVAPIEGTPAYKAGIKSGDIILTIDDTKLDDKDITEVVKMIRGKDGTKVNLFIKTGSNEPRNVEIVRSEIKIDSVVSEMKENNIGYIRITSFNEQTSEDFTKQYRELENKGMKATILDLRGNPGGLLNAGVSVAKLLVPKGPIVSVTEKSGRTLTETSNLAKVKYPLIVLVDKGTASAAEIVSGAVQDSKAGKLLGTKTYGKGCVQTVYRLGADTAVKLTMAKYYTPSGRSIDGIGLEPDIALEATDDQGTNQLNAAMEYLKKEIQ